MLLRGNILIGFIKLSRVRIPTHPKSKNNTRLFRQVMRSIKLHTRSKKVHCPSSRRRIPRARVGMSPCPRVMSTSTPITTLGSNPTGAPSEGGHFKRDTRWACKGYLSSVRQPHFLASAYLSLRSSKAAACCIKIHGESG